MVAEFRVSENEVGLFMAVLAMSVGRIELADEFHALPMSLAYPHLQGLHARGGRWSKFLVVIFFARSRDEPSVSRLISVWAGTDDAGMVRSDVICVR